MKLNEVFGVSKESVYSYIERESVDITFNRALTSTRQIIIYGSSKQGKTALLQRHVPEEKRCTVHCGPTTKLEDIYRSILRQRGVEIHSDGSRRSTTATEVGVTARFTAMIPQFVKSGFGSTVKGAESQEAVDSYKKIEFNLSVAQDVGELLCELDAEPTFYILENFHYLEDDIQRQFAFDLRTFEEMGIRVIILGVWRERNRLVQYNGDLQDRIAEVPVEPWKDEHFEMVVEKGERLLNIKISDAIKSEIYAQAHGSIAVVQEITKKVCENYSVDETIDGDELEISDPEVLSSAIRQKVEEYTARHIRSLESIAAGSRTRKSTEDSIALYLPYYLVKVIINSNYDQLRDGIERKALQTQIKELHESPDNVRTSDVSGMLKRLGPLQAASRIVPPLFDFDPGTRRVKVVDSTLYFFIDNCDPVEVMDEIPHPSPN